MAKPKPYDPSKPWDNPNNPHRAPAGPFADGQTYWADSNYDAKDGPFWYDKNGKRVGGESWYQKELKKLDNTAAPAPAKAKPAPAPVSASPYVNPLPGLHYTMGRVDQGIDIEAGAENVGHLIVAMGNAKVVSVTSDPGGYGKYIAYRLLDGPAKGQVVFVGHSEPLRTVGQYVKAGQPIAAIKGIDGPAGHIEIGWADPYNPARPLAQAMGQGRGVGETRAGQNFAKFFVAAKSGGKAPAGYQTISMDATQATDTTTVSAPTYANADQQIANAMAPLPTGPLDPNPDELVNLPGAPLPLGTPFSASQPDTWQLLSQLPGASPDTIRLSQLSSLQGDPYAPPQ